MNLRLSRKDSFGGSFFMQKRNQCKNRVKRHCKKVSQEENQRFWVPVMVKEGTSKSIDKGTTGNKSYTANWTPINYTITYNLDGGTANNKSYTAIFEKIIYTITTSKVGSGALSDNSKVEYDDSTSVFIIPAEGHTTSSLKIDGVSVNPTSKYNFLNVNKNHKVEATFTISQNRKMELMQKGYSWINLKL